MASVSRLYLRFFISGGKRSKTKRDSLFPFLPSFFFLYARGSVSERPFNSSPRRSTRFSLLPFPPRYSPGTGHHHNSVFSRARGIQSVVESMSPKSDSMTSSYKQDTVEARCENRELSQNERNDNRHYYSYHVLQLFLIRYFFNVFLRRIYINDIQELKLIIILSLLIITSNHNFVNIFDYRSYNSFIYYFKIYLS